MSSYKSEHCPGCEDSGLEDRPGITCPACQEKDAEIAKAHEALDGANVARGMAGHSLRYRIGLLKADQDEETALADRHSRLREEAETRCGLLQEEIARLRDFAAGKGMVSEAADMGEVAVLVVGLHAEIARLRALVAVGREMANAIVELRRVKTEDYEQTYEDAYHFTFKCYVPWNALYAALDKWRSLEGKR